MDDLEKVRPGQTLVVTAGTWNAFIDAARYVREQAANLKALGISKDTKPGMLLVRNDSGADITTIGAVLGLDTLLFTPDGTAKIVPIFKGVKADKTKHRGKFCILPGPVAKDAFSWAYVSAVALVRLNVPTGE